MYTRYVDEGKAKAVCNICGVIYKTLHYMRRHIRSTHFDPPLYEVPKIYTCDICMKVYNQRKCFIKHVRSHSPQGAHDIPKKYMCNICMKGVAQPMTIHLQKHRIFRCKQCYLEFPSSNELYSHARDKHGTTKGICPVKVFVCDTCGMEVRGRERDMLKHLRTHGFYTCTECPKVFKNKKRLDAHMIRRHPMPKFVCEVCNYKCAKRSVLLCHQRRVHIRERNVPCTLCDKTFFSGSALNNHMVRHNPVKKYECSFCQKMFPRLETKRRHEMIHTGQKRKVCHICDAKFVQKASLTYHMRKFHPDDESNSK